MKGENGWDFWRTVGVVALFAAGVNFLLLARLARSSLPTVVLAVAGIFLLCSAAYDVKAGWLFTRRERTRGNFSSLVNTLKNNFSPDRGRLAEVLSVVRKTIGALWELLGSVRREVFRFLRGSSSERKALSPRQKKIWFEDILARPVKEVKERVRKEGVDLRALLEAERKKRDRRELESWLSKEIKSERGETRE